MRTILTYVFILAMLALASATGELHSVKKLATSLLASCVDSDCLASCRAYGYSDGFCHADECYCVE